MLAQSAIGIGTVPELLFDSTKTAMSSTGKNTALPPGPRPIRSFVSDWPAVVALARSQKCLRMVLLGLALASRLMGAGLPAELRALLDADPITVDLAKEVERSIFDPQSV